MARYLPQEVRSALDVAALFAQEGDMQAVSATIFAKLIAAKIKHPAFTEENEWRIVILDPPMSELKFRAGHSDIKAYVELRPSAANGSVRLPLKRVIFGPTLRHDSVLVDTITLMLESYGYEGVTVEPCRIPYRL